MKFDVLHNFISPVTGRILVNTDYTIVGNAQGIGIPSPILIDIQLDLIGLRADYDILSSASFIIREPNSQLPEAEILSQLTVPTSDEPDTAKMIKVIEHGYLEIATPRVEYVTPAQLQEVKDEIAEFANAVAEFAPIVGGFSDSVAVFADAVSVFADTISAYAAIIGQEEIVVEAAAVTAAAGVVTTEAGELTISAVELATTATEVAAAMAPDA
jgi:hypothetical protein